MKQIRFWPFIKRLQGRPRLRLFLQCSLLVILIFPDVVFKNASISMLDQFNFSSSPRSVQTLYRERMGLQPYEGYFDTSGAALQSEPAIQFIKYSIYNLQSPYWNPFSGSGSFGPETMVDIKFAPLNLAVAILGGSNLAFHFVSLLFYALALYFLARIIIEHFGFSFQTALASCVVYLLNGYFTANISSNTNQPYLYFPFAIFAVLAFCRRPNISNYLMAVLAYSLAFSVTFFPTTVLMVTSVCVVAAGASIHYFSAWKKRISMLLLQASAPICSVMILSFIYLPLAEAMKYVSALDLYSQRTFNAANYQAIISLFSAKHVFELHNAMNPEFSKLVGNEIFHFGIIPGCVVAIVVFSRRWWKDALMASFTLLLILSLGRIFALPLITPLVDRLPFFRNIAEQYWWMMVACSFPLVFSYGLNLVEMAKFKLWPFILIAIVIFLDLAFIIYTFDISKVPSPQYPSYSNIVIYILKAIAITLACVAVLWSIHRQPKRRVFLTTALCFGIFFEMNYYFNTARITRSEMFSHPPDYIEFLKSHLGLHRVAAFGSVGFPAELGSAYQLQQIEFFTMNIFPTYYNLCQRDLTTEHGWWGKDTFCVNRDTNNDPNINLATLNLLSVKYLVVSRGMQKFIDFFEKQKFPHAFESFSVIIFENPDTFPRVYGVKSLVNNPKTPDALGQSAKLVAFSEDPKLIEEAHAKNILNHFSQENGVTPLFDNPKISSYENTRVVINANFSEPGILVLPDNWHPNWKATVDGNPTYIGKINESFRGIALAAGNHSIEMKYQPSTLPIALLITGLFSILLASLFFLRKKVDPYFKSLLPNIR
ncbi:MAG: YfhO family protein [Pseudobdellovibrionaceae bacterium]